MVCRFGIATTRDARNRSSQRRCGALRNWNSAQRWHSKREAQRVEEQLLVNMVATRGTVGADRNADPGTSTTSSTTATAEPRDLMSAPFFILAIDGGGYRGLFAAHIQESAHRTGVATRLARSLQHAGRHQHRCALGRWVGLRPLRGATREPLRRTRPRNLCGSRLSARTSALPIEEPLLAPASPRAARPHAGRPDTWRRASPAHSSRR